MSKDENADNVPTVTSAQLASLFDCTVRQVEIYAKQHIAIRKGRGRYDAAQSTRNLIRHLREQAAGRAGIDPSTDTAGANAERSKEQALLTRARRLKLEGQTIEVDEVRRVWSGIMIGLRQMVLGIPGRIAAVVPTLTVHDRKMVTTVCRDALKDAALGNGFQFSVTVPDPEPGDEES